MELSVENKTWAIFLYRFRIKISLCHYAIHAFLYTNFGIFEHQPKQGLQREIGAGGETISKARASFSVSPLASLEDLCTTHDRGYIERYFQGRFTPVRGEKKTTTKKKFAKKKQPREKKNHEKKPPLKKQPRKKTTSKNIPQKKSITKKNPRKKATMKKELNEKNPLKKLDKKPRKKPKHEKNPITIKKNNHGKPPSPRHFFVGGVNICCLPWAYDH